MNMKEHILEAMEEQFDLWEELVAEMSDEQVSIALIPSYWSIKDNIAHLMAWQQRSIAKVEAFSFTGEPAFPKWLPGVDPGSEDSTSAINDWIYKTYRELKWSKVHQDWREGYQRLLDSADRIDEKDLLDSDRTPWLKGYSLADVLLGSYSHHQEHLEELLICLEERKSR